MYVVRNNIDNSSNMSLRCRISLTNAALHQPKVEEAMRVGTSCPQVRIDDKKSVKVIKRNHSLEKQLIRNHSPKHAKVDPITNGTMRSYELLTENRLATEVYQHATNNSLMRSVYMSAESYSKEVLFSWDKANLSGWKTLINEVGIILLGTLNLARVAGLPDCPRPSGIKYDCILITNDNPMTVLLCHYMDADVNALREYGKTLARELAHAMRNYTGESFNILFDIIEDSLIYSVNVRHCLKTLVENNRKIYPFERLRMDAQKKQNLFTSFIDVMSTTEIDLIQCDEGSDLSQDREDRPIYLLNQEEFDVMGHIMGGEEIVIHVHVKTNLQRNFFALEVARRLNQDGGTLLVTGRRFSSTFFKKVVHSVSQGDLEDVRHVVEISSCGKGSGVKLKLQDGGKHVVFN